jgi:hypothetical protein
MNFIPSLIFSQRLESSVVNEDCGTHVLFLGRKSCGRPLGYQRIAKDIPKSLLRIAGFPRGDG